MSIASSSARNGRSSSTGVDQVRVVVNLKTAKAIGVIIPQSCERRRGDRIGRAIAAMHESGIGTFETCRWALETSAFKGRPEVTGAQLECEIDPKETSQSPSLDDHKCYSFAVKVGRRRGAGCSL
jgi:hypothetical protein